MLDSHPNLACPAETDFLATLAPLVDQELYRTGLEAMGFESDHVRLRLRRFISYFFENYAQARGKQRWVDKTPAYVDHLPFIRSVFPQAQMLLLYRHPFDQIESHTSGGARLHWSVEGYPEPGDTVRMAAARYWAKKAQNILDFEAEDAGCRRLRYEDLTADPEATLGPLLEWLGEPWDPSVLDFSRVRHSAGREDNEIKTTTGIVASVGNWSSWPAEEVAAVRESWRGR